MVTDRSADEIYASVGACEGNVEKSGTQASAVEGLGSPVLLLEVLRADFVVTGLLSRKPLKVVPRRSSCWILWNQILVSIRWSELGHTGSCLGISLKLGIQKLKDKH